MTIGAHRQLVDQRARRVGVAGPVGRVEVAAGGAARRSARAWRPAPRTARTAITLVLPGEEPMPSSASSPAASNSALELELLAGQVVEPAEVDVVAAGLQAGAHRVEVHAVAGRVHQHVDAVERRRPGRRARRPPRPSPWRRRGRRPPPARARRRGRAAAARDASSDSARSRTIAGAMMPPAPRIGDPHAHQLPRPQRQPELDPVARALRSRPVSSSTRRIR